MTKRTMRTLGLMLLATPLVAIGCGGSDNNGGTGGTGGGGGTLKYDGAAGTGGSSLDGGNTPPIDGAVVDATIVDAPVALDGSALDVAAIDSHLPGVDVAPIDTTPAIDTTPVVVVTCTEATKFAGGTVTADRTLTKACSPYTIMDDIVVNGNAALTIEPGVTLRFDPDMGIGIGYSTAAKIVAVGTAVAPIVFTSSNATPGAGDWVGVQLWGSTTNGTKFGYVTFDYCGSKGDACLVGSSVKANRVTVDHVTFSHVGAGSDAILQKDRDSSFVISNCTFNDIPSTPTQQYAITVYAQSFAGIDANNTFNGKAMVQLWADTISTDTSWKNIGTVVASDDLSIGGAATPTLTIAAGSTFKFASGAGISVGYSNPGKLVLAGTAAADGKITLTSLAATPGVGDWNGIMLWSGSSAKIAYSTISYAGSTNASSSNGAVSADSNSDSIDIQNSTISYSEQYGIGLRCGSTATLVNTGNTFTGNTLGEVGPGPDATAAACQ